MAIEIEDLPMNMLISVMLVYQRVVPLQQIHDCSGVTNSPLLVARVISFCSAGESEAAATIQFVHMADSPLVCKGLGTNPRGPVCMIQNRIMLGVGNMFGPFNDASYTNSSFINDF